MTTEPMNPAKGRAPRRIAWLGAVCLVAVAGCGGLIGLLPSEEELQAYQREQEEFQERVDALPSVRVRIINRTEVIASARIESFMQGPSEADLFGGLGYLGFEEYLATIDDQTVYVAAGGTVEGQIKCGEAITLGVDAPFDLNGIGGYSDYTLAGETEDFRVYPSGGNLQLTGAGTGGQQFTGDVIDTTRIIRPDSDGVDCASDVIVIEITSAASSACVGETIENCQRQFTPGAAVVRVEAVEGGE